MPLSNKQRNLLYEIYEVSYTQQTVVTSGSGSAAPTLFDFQKGVKQQLEETLLLIDLDEAQSARVGEILDEYDAIALDFSTIDREGYSMRPARNLKRIQKALYPYTGILFQGNGKTNKLLLG